MLSGTRQMLDAVARGRQLAISQRTTVYLVFVPPGFWNDPAFANNPALTQADRVAATNLAGLQYIGYNYLAMRSVGDQPGRALPLPVVVAEPAGYDLHCSGKVPARNSAWFISTNTPPDLNFGYNVFGFEWTTNLPFPRRRRRFTTPDAGIRRCRTSRSIISAGL